jgi:hypothetical protein
MKWINSRVLFSVLILNILALPSVFAQKPAAKQPENLVVEEDGTKYLKGLPEALAANAQSPYLTRMGEWMMKFYGKSPDETILKETDSFIASSFTTVRGYEKAYNIFKDESRKFGIILDDIYSLNESRYNNIVKDYNKQAKKERMPPVKLEGDGTTWWSGGIRVELRKADSKLLIEAMKTSNIRSKISLYVKREIDAGKPLAWAKIYGIGNKGKGYYGVRLCVITGYNEEKEELYYVNLDDNITERQTTSYDEAAAITWAFYKVAPRSK